MTESFSLQKHSTDALVTILFQNSRSHVYPLAVGIAKNADKYEELVFKKRITHVASFARTKDGAAKAMLLIDYVGGLKGTQIFTASKPANRFRTMDVLSCFIDAESCNDKRAHCHMVFDNSKRIETTERIISLGLKMGAFASSKLKKEEPIKYTIQCWFVGRTMKPDPDHPSSFNDQVQAAAVSLGCDWCPNFSQSLG